MGLLDLFKKNKKTTNPSEKKTSSLSDFECAYLYGFTNEPLKESMDNEGFQKLYNMVIGNKGGLIINGSFHPYQLVNPKGTTVWHASYVQIFTNDKSQEAFEAILNEDAQFLTSPSSNFKETNIWPDTRLSFEENPGFSKYVPFIIPFMVLKSESNYVWDDKLKSELEAKGNASDYVNSITEAIRFLMPEPAFIIGFDIFEEATPEKLIDNIINCKSLLKI